MIGSTDAPAMKMHVSDGTERLRFASRELLTDKRKCLEPLGQAKATPMSL